MRLRQMTLLLTSFFTILFYQNCNSGFKTALPLDTTNASSSIPDSQTPSPTPNPANPQPSPAPPPAGSFTLKVALSGSGKVTSNPAGIDCGSDCSENYAANTSITLIATASPGFTFKGWTGACGGMSVSCTLKISENKNVTVSFESSSPVVGSIDTVIAAMPSNSWKSLPNTQMKDVCPLPYNSYACRSVVSAWSGGAYDDKRDRMIILGGGHYDSWYNNVFTFDLISMKWERLTDMPGGAGDKAPVGWDDKRTETCGYHTKAPLILPPGFPMTNTGYVPHEKCFEEPILSQLDFQQPRSAHTYGGVYFDRIMDRYCSLAGSFYPSSQAGTNVVNCYDPVNKLWVRIPDRPQGTATGRGQSALDSKGHIWAMAGEAGYIGEFNPFTNTWTKHGYNNYDAGGGSDIDRKRHHFYTLHLPNNAPYSLRKWDLNNPESLKPSKSWTEVSATGDLPLNVGGRPGFVYADNLDLFYAWGGDQTLYIFNPETKIWKKVIGSGDNPGAQQMWGTYGRFRYSNTKGVFILVNDTIQNVFIYKP